MPDLWDRAGAFGQQAVAGGRCRGLLGTCYFELREQHLGARMDHATMGRIEREAGDAVTECFPPGIVRRVVVLQYGDNPEIEPGELMIRVVLEGSDGTDDYGQALDAFMNDHKPGLAKVRRYLSRELPEAARKVEFTFDEAGGPRATRAMFQLGPVRDAGGELTPVMARLGPVDLETLDALVTAGIAGSRAEAVRWALARIRERPAYSQLQERAREIDRLKNEF